MSAKKLIGKKAGAAGKAMVKVYSTSSCPWCMKAKEFLKTNNISFKDINVGSDEKARKDMFEKSHQFGVPVIDISGEIIVGYDPARMKKILKL